MIGRRDHPRVVAPLAAVALLMTACSGDDDSARSTVSITFETPATSMSLTTANDQVERQNPVAVRDVSTECVDGQPVLGVAVGASGPVDIRVEVVQDGRVLGDESATITPENQPLLVPVRLVSLPEKPTPTPEIHIWADVRPGPVINVSPVDLVPAESVCG